MITLDSIRSMYQDAGYTFFAQGDLNLNIFGLRTLPGVPDQFDDLLGCAWKQGGVWRFKTWPATTNPGLSYLQEHMGNPKGTAILCPGQYRGSHVVGTHSGYETLVQDRPLKVWRDWDKDGQFDYGGDVDEGVFGINIHHAGDDSPLVRNWSAGCQVFKRLEDWAYFMQIVRASAKIYGQRFTYTLLAK